MDKHLDFLKHIDKTVLPTELSVGTDCSGIEAPIHALELLGIKVNHKFSSDIDKFVISSIKANYNPEIIYDNIMTRNHNTLPHVDLYVAGFPCQAFSSLGKRAGFTDVKKGLIFFDCLNTIKAVKPKIFMLENVVALKWHDKHKTFKTIMDHLNNLVDYNIYVDIYNTLDYGLPHSRNRIYFIGLHKKYFNNGFKKPDPIVLPISITDIIETNYTQKTKLTQHKLDLLDNLIKSGKIDTLDNPWCINLNVSTIDRAQQKKNIASCLIATATKYYSPLQRELIPREMLRLQGFSDKFKIVVTNRQMVKQTGNSMSTNVICFIYEAIFKQLKLPF